MSLPLSSHLTKSSSPTNQHSPLVCEIGLRETGTASPFKSSTGVHMLPFVKVLWSLAPIALLAALLMPLECVAQVAGQNVNMVSGTQWPTGDPFFQRHNEPSWTVSTRHPMHILARTTDYRPSSPPPRPTPTPTT